MTDRLTDEQIEAVCERLTSNSRLSWVEKLRIRDIIRQLQNPWLPIESAPVEEPVMVTFENGEVGFATKTISSRTGAERWGNKTTPGTIFTGPLIPVAWQPMPTPAPLPTPPETGE